MTTMLTIKPNIMPRFQSLCLSTSAIRCRKNPLKEQKKRIQQKKLAMIQHADPFKTNVGMRHQLNNTDLPDPDDPAFQVFDHDIDITEKLESIVSTSEIDQRKTIQGLPRNVYIDKDEVRRAIVKKKYMPDPREPQLLTWMEKELVKKLHREDPLTWTQEQLSECFPVTPKSVKKILKNKEGKIKPHQIIRHNEIVRENWKLLSKNQLENSEPILEHLKTVGHKIFSNSMDKFIPSGQRQELEQRILQDYSASIQPVKPKLTGQFGSILVNHQKRVGKWKDAGENIVEIENLLDSKDDFMDSLNEPDPKLGTARINVESKSDIDEKNLTVHKFRKLFYQELKKKAATNEDAKKYFKWMRTEKKFLEMGEKTSARNILQDDIVEKNIETESTIVEDERKVQKYKDIRPDKIVLKSKSKMELKMKIDIPKDLYKENAMYQIGDCFYDSNGEFLHRIPGAIPETADKSS